MARLPLFNLTARVWRWDDWSGTLPPSGDPALDTPCQIRLYRTAFLNSTSVVTPGTIKVALLVPALTDLRPNKGLTDGAGHPDLVEVPLGSGRYYRVEGVEDVDKGFSYEYRLAGLGQLQSPLPVP